MTTFKLWRHSFRETCRKFRTSATFRRTIRRHTFPWRKRCHPRSARPRRRSAGCSCREHGTCKDAVFTSLLFLFLYGPTTASFSFIFSLFKQTIQFLIQINVKKCHVHPVYGARIRTHDHQNMSFLPQPLDQGSHPSLFFLDVHFL